MITLIIIIVIYIYIYIHTQSIQKPSYEGSDGGAAI